MKILLTGGGTAGHTWPLIYIAQSLQKNKRLSLLYVGSRQGIEKKIAYDYHVPFKAIIVGKRRAYFSLANIWDIFKIFVGIIQSFFILLFYRPNVVFAKGGYVTAPIIFWLKFFKIPLVIHESDAVFGRANIRAIKSARKICLGFPIEVYKDKIIESLSLDKVVYTGTPVNPDLLQTPIFSGERLKLLITGGSQGSFKINTIASEILPRLLQKYEIWHVSGETWYDELGKIQSPFYHLYKFTYKLPKIMRDSDLVISRAGASTLAEISASSKAAIIIPIATSANNHQFINARVYADQNAAVVLTEKNLTSSSLESIIDNLMKDEGLRKLLGHHAHGLYQPEAINSIIETIFDVANESINPKN